jgi:hypothetical protein
VVFFGGQQSLFGASQQAAICTCRFNFYDSDRTTRKHQLSNHELAATESGTHAQLVVLPVELKAMKKRFRCIELLALVIVLAMTNAGKAQAPLMPDIGYKGGSIEGLKKQPGSTNFLVLGDWGRNGENYQNEVALGMAKAAHDLQADFIVSTGDNFYPYGVQSTQDYHWIASFENIYKAQSLHVRWYPVLGNHDYASQPDAQIAYSHISSRWAMPSRYYAKQFNMQDTANSLLMLFIDTDPIEKEMRGVKHDSIKYVAGAVARQKAWIEQQLQQTTAKWKIVVGHHTPYTGGWRNGSADVSNMRRFLQPIFEKYGVQLYLCGHEHHLEHTKPAGKTHYVISGAGSEARPAQLNAEGGLFTAPTQGFACVSVSAQGILLRFIDYKHQILYSAIIPRS